jgi:D-3-phosphoglycerate dehydrogenase
MTNVLIACDMPASFIEGIEKLGYDVIYNPNAGSKEVRDVIHDFHGLVVSTKSFINKEIIDAGGKLHFIARAGSGMDTIDWQYANEKGIITISSPEGNADAVGEHALGMLLSLLNNILRSDREVRIGKWLREANRGAEIKGKTIGILGYGNTGMAFAKKLSGFGARVIAYDKYKRNFSDDYAQEASLDDIFRHADVLSLHIPLTHETRHLVNSDFLGRFSKSIYFINTARGGVMKTDDVVAALKSSKILGACLDVLEEEVNPQSHPWFMPLAQMDNVILTPHIAGWTHESRERIGEVLLRKIRALSQA